MVPFITFRSTSTNGITLTLGTKPNPSALFWVTTSAEGTMPGLKDYRVSAASDGTMSYNFPTVISVLCKIDVTYFPFDTQICKLMVGVFFCLASSMFGLITLWRFWRF